MRTYDVPAIAINLTRHAARTCAGWLEDMAAQSASRAAETGGDPPKRWPHQVRMWALGLLLWPLCMVSCLVALFALTLMQAWYRVRVLGAEWRQHAGQRERSIS